MKNIKMYHKSYCPYCNAAKKLMDKLNWQYQEIEVTHDQKAFSEMVILSGRRSVPQIFINDKHIGGFDDFQTYIKRLSQLQTA